MKMNINKKVNVARARCDAALQKDLSTRLQGITTEFMGLILCSLVQTSVVLG